VQNPKKQNPHNSLLGWVAQLSLAGVSPKKGSFIQHLNSNGTGGASGVSETDGTARADDGL